LSTFSLILAFPEVSNVYQDTTILERTVKEPSLDTLRIEIDAIDEQIHRLLMNRTELVGQVGAMKRQAGAHGFALRPGREAIILRRLAARHQGTFPAHALIKIWREVLSGTVQVQTPYSVAICDLDDPVAYRLLVRNQFSGAPIKSFATPLDTIKALRSGNVMVAVVPCPTLNATDTWWKELAFGEHSDLKIIARLPFLQPNSSRPINALAIAALRPEPSGEDISLVVVECRSDSINYQLPDLPASCKLLCHNNTPETDLAEIKTFNMLVSVDGFVEPDDELIPRFFAIQENTVTRARVIGCYPKQLVVEEGTGTS